MIRSVENQVLSHDSKTDEAEITTRFSVRSADIDAGKTRTEVSMVQQWHGRDEESYSMPGAACGDGLRCTYTAPDILAGLMDEMGGSGVLC